MTNPSCSAEMLKLGSNPVLYLTSPLVTVEVGKLKRKYYVHKALLERSSPWFAACLKPDFKEGQELKIIMEDDDADTFGAFLHWLYNGDLNAAFFESQALKTRPWMCMHVDLYILADKLLMPYLKNLVVNRVRDNLNTRPVSKAVAHLHKHEILSSKLGIMLVRHLACQIVKMQQAARSGLGSGDRSDEGELYKICGNVAIATILLRAIVSYHFGQWRHPIEEPQSAYHEIEEAKK